MPKRPRRKGLPGARTPRAGVPKVRRPTVRRSKSPIGIRRIRV